MSVPNFSSSISIPLEAIWGKKLDRIMWQRDIEDQDNKKKTDYFFHFYSFLHTGETFLHLKGKDNFEMNEKNMFYLFSRF